MPRRRWPSDEQTTRTSSYAERLDAHWNALPFLRKLHILLYLAARLCRYAPREIAAHAAACAKNVGAALGQWREGIAAAGATLRWAITAEGRYAIADFVESLVTFRAIRIAAPIIALAILLAMLGRVDRNVTDPGPDSARAYTVVEAARRARHFRPPPCYLTGDGEVWIDAEGGPIRPGSRNYRVRRQDVCGF